MNCPEEYIGESGRTFGDRFKEHLRTPSPIYHHCNSTGHPVSPECYTIIDREPQLVTRNIKEAMYIHVNDPSLNRNIGKYQLLHIWDQVLQDILPLQLKQSSFTSLLHGPPHPPTIIVVACTTSLVSRLSSSSSIQKVAFFRKRSKMTKKKTFFGM